jgi:zinc/manganese transport system substrate-binding protein
VIRARATAVALVVVIAAPLAGGCDEGAAGLSGPPQIVAAENMWGSIAAQLAGRQADVASIITNPAEDPHAYEPTASDGRTLAEASLAIVNGIGYDPWASRLLAANPSPGRIVLNVGDLVRGASGGNPHRWYDPGDVASVAAAITAALQRLDPAHRAQYAAHLAHFTSVSLASYHAALSLIRRRYAGTAVGASESIFSPLAAALGLRLLTPPSFLKAVSEGNDISAGDATVVSRQIASRAVSVWVLNSQNTTPEISQLSARARRAGIPVVTITETLAPATDSFEAWQTAQLRALARALHQGTGR